MLRLPRLLISVVATALLVMVGIAGWSLWPRQAPPSPTASQAAEVLARLDLGTPATAPTPAAPLTGPADGAAAPEATAPPPAPFAGTWTVLAGAPTSLGYRVEQILAGQGVSTVVGHTAAVQATMSVDGQSLTAASVTADLTQLSSDQVLRDRTLRETGLETNAFPSAHFELTAPLDLSGLAQDGAVVHATAEGNLELHGVTRPVTVPVDVQARNGAVAITGAFQLTLADFGISQPHVASVLSIGQTGIVEFQLYLSRA
jgi:polyisoprenoid-binding protein YceI